MNYFLILCGLVLIILTAPSILLEWSGKRKIASLADEEQDNFPDILYEYLQSMEDRLEAMADTLAEMTQVMSQNLTPNPRQEHDFTEVLYHTQQENKPLSINEQIYQGFLSGKSVTELAQEFGRGKGEIELVLNLKR